MLDKRLCAWVQYPTSLFPHCTIHQNNSPSVAFPRYHELRYTNHRAERNATVAPALSILE